MLSWLARMSKQPKSILRNAPSTGTYEPSGEHDSAGHEIDRNKVLQNTRANAQLHDEGARLRRASEPEEPVERPTGDAEDHLKWDEANIYRNEQEKTATMKIDEPKTPYQGPAGDSEYYLPDEDEDIVKTRDDKVLAVDELDEFSLGETQYDDSVDATVENDRIQKDPNVEDEGDDEDDDEEHLTADERKRRFEAMRKAHYHMKGNVLRQPMPPVDDDDDNE